MDSDGFRGLFGKGRRNAEDGCLSSLMLRDRMSREGKRCSEAQTFDEDPYVPLISLYSCYGVRFTMTQTEDCFVALKLC